MDLLDCLLRQARLGSHGGGISVVHEYVLEELRRQIVDLHARVYILGQNVVGHVDGAVSQGLDEPLLIPGQMRAQTLTPGAGFVLQPVDLVLELHPKLRRDDAHVCQTAEHVGLPLRI